jgi:hypothetical protein
MSREVSEVRRTIVALVIAALMALVGCSSEPDAAACKQAMGEDYARALANPSGPPASKPAACEGWTTRRWSGWQPKS